MDKPSVHAKKTADFPVLWDFYAVCAKTPNLLDVYGVKSLLEPILKDSGF